MENLQRNLFYKLKKKFKPFENQNFLHPPNHGGWQGLAPPVFNIPVSAPGCSSSSPLFDYSTSFAGCAKNSSSIANIISSTPIIRLIGTARFVIVSFKRECKTSKLPFNIITLFEATNNHIIRNLLPCLLSPLCHIFIRRHFTAIHQVGPRIF